MRAWRLSSEMLEAQLALLREERDRLRRTVRYRVGDAILRWGRAPWRVVRLASDVAGALRDGRASCRPFLVHGVGPAGKPVAPGSPLFDRLRRLHDEIDALQRTPAFRLGSRLVRLRAPWRLLLARRRSWRESASWRHRPLPEPAPARPAVPRDPSPDGPALACEGPAWFRAMAGADGLPARSENVLLAIDGRPPPRPPPAARRLACWAVDGPPHPDWTDTLRRADAVFAADPAVTDRLRATLERKVTTLPPAVQPLLQNPIGYWNDEQGPPAPWEAGDGDALPPDWALLQDVARTRDPDAAGAARVGALLGAPLPEPPAPAWADPDTARLWVRRARLRRVLRDACLARRLAGVADELGVEGANAAPPLASVKLCTNRPAFLPAILAQIAAQTYPRLELVLTLHGDGFDRDAVDRLVAALPMPVTLLRTPASLTLGESLQVASDHARGDLVVRVDDDDRYGPHYVEDFMLDAGASPAGVFAKTCLPTLFERTGRMILLQLAAEYHYALGGAGGGRMAYRPGVTEHVTWRRTTRSEDAMFARDCVRTGIPILAGDRFGTVLVRRDPRTHTWQIRESSMRRSGAVPLPAAARPEDFHV